jgi:hypothetical protein
MTHKIDRLWAWIVTTADGDETLAANRPIWPKLLVSPDREAMEDYRDEAIKLQGQSNVDGVRLVCFERSTDAAAAG